MKKSGLVVLLILTLLFVAFVAGFYVGRNSNHSSVQISGVPKYTFPISTPATLPTEPTVPTTLDAMTERIMAAINAATLEELDEVTNIGPVTAQAILDYRREYGDFTRPEDLLRVSGIGNKTLQNILEHFQRRLTNEDTGC